MSQKKFLSEARYYGGSTCPYWLVLGAGVVCQLRHWAGAGPFTKGLFRKLGAPGQSCGPQSFALVICSAGRMPLVQKMPQSKRIPWTHPTALKDRWEARTSWPGWLQVAGAYPKVGMWKASLVKVVF